MRHLSALKLLGCLEEAILKQENLLHSPQVAIMEDIHISPMNQNVSMKSPWASVFNGRLLFSLKKDWKIMGCPQLRESCFSRRLSLPLSSVRPLRLVCHTICQGSTRGRAC